VSWAFWRQQSTIHKGHDGSSRCFMGWSGEIYLCITMLEIEEETQALPPN